MNANPIVSVVVPIYNVEEYLPRCVNSILNQTYPHLEIILVDDGSPDRCGVICDEYATQDSRIQVIHQSNDGVVRARNVGLAVAHGKYLAFVDADDLLESQMYETMVRKAEEEQSQIVWCDWREESGKKTIDVSANFENDPEVMLRKLFTDEVKGYLWNKLIRKDFYDSCRLKVDENCVMMEDKYMLVQLLCANPKMSYVAQGFYHYVSRTDSAVGRPGLSPLVKGAANVEHMYDVLREKGLLEKYKREFYRYAMQVKFAFADAGKIMEGQRFIAPAHQSVDDYPVSKPIALFYWFCFNTGRLGVVLLNLYKFVLKNN